MAIDEINGGTAATRRDRVQSLPAFGVWAPAVTPLDQDLSPDPDRFVALLRWLLEVGCHGVVVFGTTGEAPSFSVDERIALLDAALEAGLPADRLIVGTGCPALTDTVRLTADAVGRGCAGVLVVPPYYFKEPSEDGVFAGYSELVERVGTADLRLYLYHFPRLSCVSITHGLIARLRDRFPGVVAGVKDSSGDWQGTRGYLERFPDLAIFPGTEVLQFQALSAGGAGCITATANVNAHGLRSAFDAWCDEDAAAERRQEEITAVRRALDGYPVAPALKHLLADHRGDPAWRRVRPPFVPLSDEDGAALKRSLEEAGFGFPGN